MLRFNTPFIPIATHCFGIYGVMWFHQCLRQWTQASRTQTDPPTPSPVLSPRRSAFQDSWASLASVKTGFALHAAFLTAISVWEQPPYQYKKVIELQRQHKRLSPCWGNRRAVRKRSFQDTGWKNLIESILCCWTTELPLTWDMKWRAGYVC